MAYYDQYYSEYPQIQIETPLFPERRSNQEVVRRRMMLILATVLLLIVPMLVSLRPTLIRSTPSVLSNTTASQEATEEGNEVTANPVPAGPSGGQLAAVFTPEVRHWEPQILAWAEEFGLDPNLVAIIMQIESCGDPHAVSVAGAQGLFQVMPFHFAAGENTLDPNTNARRGLNYFVERLNQTGGDIGRAFAGYNGGHVAAGSSWDQWAHETQRYYVWSTGIYSDIQSGEAQSATVQDWLQAGGASLCRQAASRLGL